MVSPSAAGVSNGQITAKVDTDPAPSYRWSLNGTPVATTTVPQNVFTGLSGSAVPGTMYTITVQPLNAAGQATQPAGQAVIFLKNNDASQPMLISQILASRLTTSPVPANSGTVNNFSYRRKWFVYLRPTKRGNLSYYRSYYLAFHSGAGWLI